MTAKQRGVMRRKGYGDSEEFMRQVYQIRQKQADALEPARKLRRAMTIQRNVQETPEPE